jgi:2-polyprenyl-3-methyl-5-hydroxy-6-metoxy-1,4-benzoquinol methylase
MNNRLLETKEAFHDPQWYFQKRNYHVRVRVETVGEFLDQLKFGRILDIGCGDGSISLPLLTRENRLTLLDMSDGMLARAQSRIPPNLSARVEIMKSDFMNARLEVNSYDLIICLGVLAYVNPAQPFLAKVASLLKPGGRLILEWTDSHHFASRCLVSYNALSSRLVPPSVKVELTLHRTAEIINCMSRLGFEVEGSYRYLSPLPVVRRLLGDALNYRLIRVMHGSAKHNRAPWLGHERIFYFQKSSRPGQPGPGRVNGQ